MEKIDHESNGLIKLYLNFNVFSQKTLVPSRTPGSGRNNEYLLNKRMNVV